jgi:DNA-binding response OmpR family regulator
MAVVLLVTVDEQFRDRLRGALHAYQHQVVTALTCSEALQHFEDRRPALAVLDLDVLGLDALVQFRARFPRVPVVAVGELMSVVVENQARDMGAADVLRKTLKSNVLMQVVNRVLQHAESPASRDRTGRVPAGEGAAAKILVVDDEREIRDMIGEFLQRRGYRVRTAADGEEALEALGAEPFDMILLDVYMPGVNGIQLLERLAKSGRSSGVIVLTACQDQHLLKATLDLGAFEVLTKPVDLEQLELAVSAKLHS